MNQREMQVVLNLVTQNNLIVYVITIYSNDVVRMTKKPELKKQKTKTKNKKQKPTNKNNNVQCYSPLFTEKTDNLVSTRHRIRLIFRLHV